MPSEIDTSSGWKRQIWPHPGKPGPGSCSPVLAPGLFAEVSLTPVTDCIVPPVSPLPTTCTTSDNLHIHLSPSPPPLGLERKPAVGGCWVVRERNKSGLSGALLLQRTAAPRPSQYLDVVAFFFVCPFLIRAEPSGREPGKRLRGESKGKHREQCKRGNSQCHWETITASAHRRLKNGALFL